MSAVRVQQRHIYNSSLAISTMAGVLIVATLAVGGSLAVAPPQFARIARDKRSNTFWVVSEQNVFLTLGVNHVNDGGLDDGVDGRESVQCRNRTGNPNCGDTLNFCGALNTSVYHDTLMGTYYNSSQKWTSTAASRLSDWGFNTLGGWSSDEASSVAGKEQGLFYAKLLDIGTTWLNHDGFDNDMYSSAWPEQARAIAAAAVAPRANDPFLLGWQLDNEPNWETIALTPYLQRTTGSPGQQASVAYLERVYKDDIKSLNAAWDIEASSFTDVVNHLSDKGLNHANFQKDSDSFMTQTASLYFNVSCTAIRAHDKNHMILGVRNAHAVPAAVIEAMVGWVDVVDQHCYEDGPPSNLEQIHNITGRPVMVGEFSFTAIDSNLPNTVGARRGNPYMTQRQRANQFQSFVSTLMEIPYAIGFHWWQYNDEPSLGRWPDGEDSNYGIVSLSDEPYTALVNQMTETNAAIPQLHAGQKAIPTWADVEAGYVEILPLELI